MKTLKASAFPVALAAIVSVAALLALGAGAHADAPGRAVDFGDVSLGDAVVIDGHGSFDALTGDVRLGGHFRSTKDIAQGPFAGCLAGEGIRWRATALLASSGFKCVGGADEPLKTAFSDFDTAVFQADFFRAGDGTQASFSAKVFVSASDEDPGQPGVQNVWIQGVGCGESAVSLR